MLVKIMKKYVFGKRILLVMLFVFLFSRHDCFAYVVRDDEVIVFSPSLYSELAVALDSNSWDSSRNVIGKKQGYVPWHCPVQGIKPGILKGYEEFAQIAYKPGIGYCLKGPWHQVAFTHVTYLGKPSDEDFVKQSLLFLYNRHPSQYRIIPHNGIGKSIEYLQKQCRLDIEQIDDSLYGPVILGLAVHPYPQRIVDFKYLYYRLYSIYTSPYVDDEGRDCYDVYYVFIYVVKREELSNIYIVSNSVCEEVLNSIVPNTF